MSVQGKIETVYDLVRDKKVVVAASGGVDSSTLLALCKDVSTEVIALTIVSSVCPDSSKAESVAEFLDIPIKLLQLDPLDSEDFRSNPPDRCYHCKKEDMTEILKEAQERGFDVVVEGTNYSDLIGQRPGKQAVEELGVLSPLETAKLTKKEIREIATDRGYPWASWPASPCLASRIPYGQEITETRLQRVEKGEKIIEKVLKPSYFRLRDHGELARLEFNPQELENLMRKLKKGETRKKLVVELQELGYRYIVLDLEGYRPSTP